VFGTEPSIGTNVVGWVWIAYRTSEEEPTQRHCRIVGSVEADVPAATEAVAKKGMDFMRSIMKVDVDDFNYPEVHSAPFDEVCFQKDSDLINQSIPALKEDVKKQQHGWVGTLCELHVLQRACVDGSIIREQNGDLIPELVTAGVTAHQAQPLLSRVGIEVFRVYSNSAKKRRSFGVLEA
jgi:hypothetical protein